ncbi:hypothetical protein ACFLSP_00215 [Bacteroidota bacterium]
MKNLGFYFLSALITGSLFFAGCTLDDTPEIKDGSILPETFAVDIPDALSHEGGKKSAAEIDTLKGNDVYELLRFYIRVGEFGAEIVGDIIKAIHIYEINKPMEVTFESDDDGRVKHLVVVEESEYDGHTWEFQLTITDVDSESNNDGGKALQVFWDRFPVRGIALIKPANIDDMNAQEMGEAMFRVDYSEDNPFYDATMMVYVAGLPMPTPLEEPYAMKAMKMFAGKKGDIIDVFGNSDHPNAILISGQPGFNWAFVASGNEVRDLGVAEVGLPPSNLDEPSRNKLLGYYGLSQVFEREIKAVWGGLVPQSVIDAYLVNAEAPGYFDNHGFVAAGTSPGSEYDELDSRLPDLSPFNPKEIGNLSLEFK